jgi:flagellar biosynthesis chaperone FliJ
MPSRFHFALQPLLDRRRRVEEEKLHRFTLQRRERDSAACAGDRLVAALAKRSTRACDAPTLAAFDAAIAAQRRRAAAAQTALDAARDELIAASRERRVIERLRERRLRAYQEEAARRDELEIEEANARRRAR